MDQAGYITLSRQSGLLKEMQVVANNIANISTTGFRREAVLFTEFLRALPTTGGGIAMTEARARVTDPAPGAMVATGGALDLAIEGAGFFLVEAPAGERLTRAGAFQPDADGIVVTVTGGHPLLDVGGAPIQLPPDAVEIRVAADGTLSADGAPVAQIALVLPEAPETLRREDGVLFVTDGGLVPADLAVLRQGLLEQSNVNPVTEIARMIAVQRAYEAGASLLDREDERIRNTLRTLGQRG